MNRFLFLCCIYTFPLSGQTPSLTKLFTGFDEPTHIVSYKEGLIVSELKGVIKYIPNLNKDSAVVMGVIPKVQDTIANGVYGLALHPNFPDSNYLYVHYTYDTTFYDSRLSKFTIVNDKIDTLSEKIIFADDNLVWFHQGGNPIFGKDGYLYLPKGDGDLNTAPKINGQDPSTFKGSILRIDPSGDDFPADVRKNYKIPIDNPFVDSSGILNEVFAFGFRNPWRITSDFNTDDIYVGDVGWNRYEEINILQSGNFGWSCFEGPLKLTEFDCYLNNSNNLIDPIFYGAHNYFSSITGGYVYRGTQYPRWNGKYFFGDFASEMLCMLDADGVACWNSSNSISIAGSFVTFGEDHNQELYVADYILGDIYKLDTTIVDCSNLQDSLVVTMIDTTIYNSMDYMSIQVDSIEGVIFTAKEIEVLPSTSFYGVNGLINADACDQAQNGIRY